MEETLRLADGMVNRGNWTKIKKVMKKAEKGEPIRVAFLGGSITQGCLATVHEKCYSYLTYEWFCNNFPSSEVKYINAGIGGTTSQFGVSRVDKDVLSYNPDLLFIEFSVNDENTDFFKETYEGLIRHVHNAKPDMALMIIHNIKYDDGMTAQEKHLELGKYYDIPCVSMVTTLYAMLERGEVKSLDITEDNLHPNDRGHRDLCDVITYYLNEIKKDLDNEEEAEKPFPKAVTANEYSDSRRYQCKDIDAVLKGFVKDEREKDYYTDNFKGGWIAKNVGDAIEFEVEGSGIAIQYKQTVNKPAPIAEAILDGDEAHPLILDANFTEDWGDNLRIDNLLVHGENKLHRVTVRIKEAHEDDKSEFYLLSVIASREEKDPLMFVEPVLKERIWGGSRLITEWGYPSEKKEEIGECWAISAHEEADCRVTSGLYENRTLSELWKNERGLFGNLEGDKFPLLVKVIDAKDDLSIQVHPDDEYAGKYENSFGKKECWYVLDCPENATLVIGNNAANHSELEEMIAEGRWSQLCNQVPVKKGDFLQIDPGTLHAIKGGFLILETQQNSDVTYRVYDYDRMTGGKKRELHLKQSLDVIKTPDKWEKENVIHVDQAENKKIDIIDTDLYRIWKMHVNGVETLNNKEFPYLLVSIISGEGMVGSHPVKKGAHFVMPCGCGEVRFSGDLDMIISTSHVK